LLSLYSSPIHPVHLYGQGRPTVDDENRLIGKHFPYIHPAASSFVKEILNFYHTHTEF